MQLRAGLSSDFYDARSLKAKGGHSLSQAATVFGPMLLQAVMTAGMMRGILVDNARRFLAFRPV